MRYLNFLPSTRLSKLQLLDIALVLSLIPHLFTLKLPMLIYMLIGLIFIIKKKDSKTTVMLFMFAGLIAIGLSFFAEYNFSSLSRLLVFISLLVSLLVHAVILQRLTRTINRYLLLSPAMLMILSFFFFNSIGMLFYALFTLFCFTLLLLYERMQSTFFNALRINGLLYLFSLPIVVLLFITFPRISYKNASFGFKGEEIKRTGHDGTMFIDSKALLVPSNRLVMEVSFEKEIPPQDFLYFRGSTLYVDKGNQWVHGPKATTQTLPLVSNKTSINYNIKLYPHLKRWLYMLDIPLTHPKDSYIDTDFITHAKQPLKEVFQYSGRSDIFYRGMRENISGAHPALQVDIARDMQTYKLLRKTIDINDDDTVKAKALIDFFISRDLSYSLKPKSLNLEHPVDSFLLDSKVGYCVHFASAFATAARMIGIPSRIVTGYKADKSNAINNYLIITEADAHAWVELYLKDVGWKRFEPTSTARHILVPDEKSPSNSYTQAYMQQTLIQKTFKQININYLYARHLLNKWILQYDRFKQVNLLKKLLADTLFLLKFIASITLVIVASFVLFLILQKKRSEDILLREMQVLLRRLNKDGFLRLQGENMNDFLSRVSHSQKRYEGLDEINRIYHYAQYGREKEKYPARLRAAIRKFLKGLKNGS